ncbi:hypothetical protein Tco_0624821 [Tanacetum coccineum]|uniref:Uncharacterized protein n=1 Tax=Tanacetum coccineum TaxID=301880 RepID=A0ABQ4WF08_9ASTR
MDWEVLNNMGCAETIEEMLEIKVYEMGGDEEIFTYEAWRHAFDIREPVYTNLCHEFYATYEFDETFTDEELMSREKVIIVKERRLWYSLIFWILLSFRDKVQRNDLWLMSMFEAKHQNGYANVAWLIEKWLKRKGVGSQRDSMICCGQFITKIARPLDTTTFREQVDSNGRLIAEEPAPGDPRVVVPRPLHHSIYDLYDRMGRMDIRQGHYDVPLQGAYTPPDYDGPQQQ